MILVDFSQIAIAGIMQFQDDLKNGSDEKIVSLIRHVVLNSLLSNKKKFGQEYGNIVICADGKNYWRKQVFKYYKAHRAKNREASPLNWNLIFNTLSQLRDELAEHFPYKVIHVETAEADDVIGVLTKWSQENETVQRGLVDEPQKVLILTSDQDNFQLHRFKNVKQFSPMAKKFVKPDNAQQALITKIVTGDTGDGIPNIMSDDDTLITEGKRQKAFRKDRLPLFFEHGIDACKTEIEKRNYQRNERLVSYEFIPEELQKTIIDTYTNQPVKGSKKTIYSYLIANRCKNLLEHIEDF